MTGAVVEQVGTDERLEGLEKSDKKLIQMFNLKIEPIRAAAREQVTSPANPYYAVVIPAIHLCAFVVTFPAV